MEAVKEEVEKLKQLGVIKEVFFPKWLTNTMVVKKKNGKWRVCVDFTDLNRACPKDPFLVPKIDQLVDATVRHQRMSFLDTFQGENFFYHTRGKLPLHSDAFRAEEGGGYVSTDGHSHVQGFDR